MKSILKFLVVVIFLCSYVDGNAQDVEISSITRIKPPKNHYKHLMTLSSQPEKERESMDTITFPSSLYKSSTLLLALSKPVYLTSSQVDFLVNAVEFPANSSTQTRAELDFLLDLQKNRTKEQSSRVMEIARVGYWPDINHVSNHPDYKENLNDLFWELREVIGEECNAENYPATAELLKGVMQDMRLMEFAVKYRLLRARPYQLEPKLKPLKEIGSPSFASGHTLWAYMQAYTLAELIPEKREEFLELAYEVGFSRELMGVHYPSDEEVARQISHRIISLIWNTSKFQEDFNKAHKEWN